MRHRASAARRPRRATAALAVAALLAGCSPSVTVTDPPSVPPATPSPTPGPSVSEVPFRPASLPADGSSACGSVGYAGRLGRIEAPDARTVRFTLCAPDGAFLARIAHPALAVLDSGTLERLAADPAAGQSLAGTGPFRIERWEAGSDVILVAAGEPSDATSGTRTVVLRWATDPGQRLVELQSATVDGIDAPGALELERIAGMPELQVVPRAGLATAYLAFGRKAPFSDGRVRRAIAAGLDRAALAEAAFPPGSVAPTHVVPCVVSGACEGDDWYGFNAPSAVAALQAAKFKFDATVQLHVPGSGLPGLPDPVGVATAIADQLEANLGMKVAVDVMNPADYAEAAAAGELDGLHLGGIVTSLADPAGILEPLFGPAATRELGAAVPAISEALAATRMATDPAARATAFGRVNDAIRTAAPLVPLAHPGTVTAFRTDVTGVRTSPFGLEPLGTFTPGDRRQLVFMGTGEPSGAWCGDQSAIAALRLCGLVTEGLYGFDPGTLDPRPRLAEACTPNTDATVWTCTLRDGVRFHDGTALDAGDVLASYAAQWDLAAPLHVARRDATWSTWLALFGGFLGTPAAAG